MSDFSYINNYSDKAILKDIGNFIRQKRLEQNISQQKLSDKASISRSTLSLMERGENIVLINLIKILRILDVLYVFESFQVKPQISPMLLAEAERKKRKKAGSKKDNENQSGW